MFYTVILSHGLLFELTLIDLICVSLMLLGEFFVESLGVKRVSSGSVNHG